MGVQCPRFSQAIRKIRVDSQRHELFRQQTEHDFRIASGAFQFSDGARATAHAMIRGLQSISFSGDRDAYI